MNVLADLARIGRQIIIRHSYYGIFLSTLNRKVDNDPQRCPTAGVSKNGLNTQIAVNEEFWYKLSQGEKMFVLIHELLHICLFHITMRQSYRDYIMFNIAADLEINQYLFAMDDVDNLAGALKLEDHGFDPKNEALKGTRYYYEKLMQKREKNQLPKGTQQLYEAMAKGEQTICSHKTWNEFEGLTESEKRVIEEQIRSQMKSSWENVDKSRGNIPNALKGILDEILKPKKAIFDWRRTIRQFTGAYSNEIFTKKLRRKYNKRFPAMPGLKIKNQKSLLCAVDTSGSVSKDEFIEFMREIDVVRRAGVHVTVVECDAYVDKEKGVYKFTGLSSIQDRKVTGGGGTSFDPPIEFLNEEANKYSALIYFTDGYAPCPDTIPRRPVMWVISQSGDSIQHLKEQGFPGVIIRIPEEENFHS